MSWWTAFEIEISLLTTFTWPDAGAEFSQITAS